MPETFTDTLRSLALTVGVPALLLFWYACRVRHPARPRWRAFLMALAVLAALPATYAAGIHYGITVRDESPFILLPVALSFPVVLRALLRGWLRRPTRERPTGAAPTGPTPAAPGSTGPGVSPGGPERKRRTAQPLTRPERGGIRAVFVVGVAEMVTVFRPLCSGKPVFQSPIPSSLPLFSRRIRAFLPKVSSENEQAPGLYVLVVRTT